jgi:hypothetical protein
VVQVTKGAIGNKGPRVTTNLVLPGRYLVLLPNSDQCGISRKIESAEERQRLKRILRKLTLPEGMGVIMRTAGQGQKLRYFVARPGHAAGGVGPDPRTHPDTARPRLPCFASRTLSSGPCGIS